MSGIVAIRVAKAALRGCTGLFECPANILQDRHQSGYGRCFQEKNSNGTR